MFKTLHQVFQAQVLRTTFHQCLISSTFPFCKCDRLLLSFFHTYHQLCCTSFSKVKFLQARSKFPNCFRPSSLLANSKFYLVCQFIMFISGRVLSLPVYASLANYLEWLQGPKNYLSLSESCLHRGYRDMHSHSSWVFLRNTPGNLLLLGWCLCHKTTNHLQPAFAF